jgi:hypothetical protein
MAYGAWHAFAAEPPRKHATRVFAFADLWAAAQGLVRVKPDQLADSW